MGIDSNKKLLTTPWPPRGLYSHQCSLLTGMEQTMLLSLSSPYQQVYIRYRPGHVCHNIIDKNVTCKLNDCCCWLKLKYETCTSTAQGKNFATTLI